MKTKTRSRSAFSLVEVTLALGVASFSLVPLFALLPVGLNSTKQSVEQMAAANILTAAAANLRGAPSPSGSAVTYISEDGQSSNVLNASSRWVLHTWTTSPSAYSFDQGAGVQAVGNRSATRVRLLLTWPPGANYLAPGGSVETSISVDSN